MLTLILFTILALTTLVSANEKTPKDDKSHIEAVHEIEKIFFKPINDFPIIQDTSKFIAELKKIYKLEVDYNPNILKEEKITTFKKVKLYGSDKDFIINEFDYGDGSGASYPWKYQLLTLDVILVKCLSVQRFEFIEIFKNENPFLLTVAGTFKGNGGHELYKITADTLENVYEGYFDYAIRTYDAHHDNSVNEPNEFNLIINDYNDDGLNDIAFVGKIVYIQGQTKNGVWFDSETINGKYITYSIDNPYKKIQVELIFIYDKQSGHFKTKESYTKKYKLN